MTTVRITEFNKTATNATPVNLPVPQYPAVAVQAALTPTSSSQSSAAFNAKTTYIGVSSDVDVLFDVGPAPVATTNSELLPAGDTRYLGVVAGDKIAVKLP